MPLNEEEQNMGSILPLNNAERTNFMDSNRYGLGGSLSGYPQRIGNIDVYEEIVRAKEIAKSRNFKVVLRVYKKLRHNHKRLK